MEFLRFDMTEPCLVLFVCTANICRSPAAEYLARHLIGEQDFVFRSAGFLFEGRDITDKMAHTLESQGILDAKDHRSHILDDATLEAADLIFTMESRHLRDITIRNREFFDKTVPLKEAAERLEWSMSRDEFLDDLSGRDASKYFDERWDVADPYKRSSRHYREAVTSIRGLVTEIFGKLKT